MRTAGRNFNIREIFGFAGLLDQRGVAGVEALCVPVDEDLGKVADFVRLACVDADKAIKCDVVGAGPPGFVDLFSWA